MALIAVLIVHLLGCGEQTERGLLASAKGHLEKREYGAAIVQLKSALQNEPASREVRFLLGSALLEQGNATAALVELEKARDLGLADEQLAPKLARAWLANGKFKEILQAYKGTTLKSVHSQAELRTAVGMAHAWLNQRPEANAAIDEALSSDPNYPWALLSKARLEVAIGNVDEGLALAGRAILPGAANGDAHLLRGIIFQFAKKDMGSAIKAYHQASLDPLENFNAVVALIGLHLSQNQLVEAKAKLADLQKSHPRVTVTLFLEASLAYLVKDYQRVVAITDQLLRVEPANVRLLTLAGAAQLQRGEFVAAEAKLGRVVQTVEQALVARKLLAETYLRMGQPEKSLAVLRPLLERGMDFELAGKAHLVMGNLHEADVMFSEALKLKPKDVQIRTALALSGLIKGKAEAAIEALEGIATTDEGDTADLALIGASLRMGNFASALSAAERLLAKQPSSVIARHLRAESLRSLGDLAGARLAYAEALKLNPTHFASTAGLVAIDVADGKLSDARRRLDAAIALTPRDAAALVLRIGVMSRQGAKDEEIAAAISDAIRLAPNEAGPRLLDIERRFKMNDHAGALSSAQSAHAVLPNHPAILDALGRAHLHTHELMQAIAVFKRLSSITPRSPLSFFRLSDVYATQGDTKSSRDSLRQAFELAPKSDEARRRLGLLAKTDQGYRFAIELVRGLQKKSPGSAIGYMLEGDVEATRKSFASALVLYRVALGKSDASSEAATRVYDAHEAQDDRARALAFAEGWVKAHSRDTLFIGHVAERAMLRNDKLTAEKWFSNLVTMEPNNGSALNNLAWLLATRRASGAVSMAERALVVLPGRGAVLDTYAKALAAERRLPEAVAAQRRAVDLAPDQPAYRLALAELYAQVGDRAKALSEVKEVEALGDKFNGQKLVVDLKRRLGER